MPVTMSVELAHDDAGDAFEADALNVSAGGLGMRSAMLPDIGQRMVCRFDMPELDGACEAEGEVVWASDEGADAGEFGIRFDTLEPRIGDALARWVSTLEGESPAVGKKSTRFVRVLLDGVASPIDAEIAMRSGEVLRVEQSLPFLALGTGALVARGSGAPGERRVLRSVELRVEGNVPRLVLELVSTGSAPSTVADASLDELLDARAPAARISDEDDALADDDEDRGAAAQGDDAEAELADCDAPGPPRASVESRPPKRQDDEAREIRLDASDREISVDALVASATELCEPEEDLSLSERLRALAATAGPRLTRTLAALARGWAAFIVFAGPRAQRTGTAFMRGLRALGAAMRDRAPRALERVLGRTPKRRTTAPPPPERVAPVRGAGREATAARRAASREEATVVARRMSPRAVVAVVLTVGAAAMVARAVFASDPSADELPIHAVDPVEVSESDAEAAPVEPSLATGEATAVPSEATTTTAAAVTAATTAAPVATPVASGPAGAMPAPTTEAGRIPAPTFPAVGDGEAGAEPALARTIDDDGDLIFGAADVPRGRSSTLRMTLPVTAIEGESDASGFTVTFHGALSLDRAGPIAAANPSVERAAILNRGDHAVLTVRFVAGRTPAYRVEASGSSATITIGR